MAEPIIILGVGGNCVDILDTIAAINASAETPQFACVGFLDDALTRPDRVCGVPVLGPLAAAQEHPECLFVNGIGSPNNYWRKSAIIATTGVARERFATLVHPTASVSPLSRLGPGSVVLQNVTIASYVSVGAQVIVLPNSVLSHDDQVGDYSCIAGGVCVSGSVVIGASCYLGANSTIIGNVEVGEFSLVGMGSVVLDDVPDRSIVVGNPAKLLRKVDMPLEEVREA